MATFKKVLGIYKLHQPCFWRAVCGQPPAKLLRRLRHRLVDAEDVAAVERRRRQRRERVELARVGLQRNRVILGAGHLSQTSAVFALRHGCLIKVSNTAKSIKYCTERILFNRKSLTLVDISSCLFCWRPKNGTIPSISEFGSGLVSHRHRRRRRHRQQSTKLTETCIALTLRQDSRM